MLMFKQRNLCSEGKNSLLSVTRYCLQLITGSRVLSEQTFLSTRKRSLPAAPSFTEEVLPVLEGMLMLPVVAV